MFGERVAVQELEQIASKPSTDFVFQVENFEALENIRKNLQERIFSIEGTNAIFLKPAVSARLNYLF